jgi:hypothetical protein
VEIESQHHVGRKDTGSYCYGIRVSNKNVYGDDQFSTLHQAEDIPIISRVAIESAVIRPDTSPKALRRFCAHARFQPHRTAIKQNVVTDRESGPLRIEFLYTGLVSLRYLVHDPALRSGLRQWMYCPNPNCSGVTYD